MAISERMRPGLKGATPAGTGGGVGPEFMVALPGAAEAVESEGGLAAALYELTKPRITRLVTITAGVGFTVQAVTRSGEGQAWDAAHLAIASLGCLLGTALSASGASALNQWLERDRDALMHRTSSRPLPSGRVSAWSAMWMGLALCIAGVGVLGLCCGPAAALISLFTIVTYVWVYTPLKTRTALNTLVGAVPGALPPLIGWAAAHPEAQSWSASGFASLAEAGGWALFLIMFVWQMPHFLAIAWMYREDYARGGYRMLPILDRTGNATSSTILVWALALTPVSLAPAAVMSGRVSAVYVVIALLSGALFAWLCARMARRHDRSRARAVFLASIAHLPLLLIALVGDVLCVAWF